MSGSGKKEPLTYLHAHVNEQFWDHEKKKMFIFYLDNSNSNNKLPHCNDYLDLHSDK
jgi:hypothetical protein